MKMKRIVMKFQIPLNSYLHKYYIKKKKSFIQTFHCHGLLNSNDFNRSFGMQMHKLQLQQYKNPKHVQLEILTNFFRFILCSLFCCILLAQIHKKITYTHSTEMV